MQDISGREHPTHLEERCALKQHCAPVLLLCLLAAAGFGQLLKFGETPYSAHSDIISYHAAIKWVLFHSLERGEGLPFLRYDQLAGTSAAVDPQSLFTYPLHLLFYLLAPPNAAGPVLFLHLIVAAIGYYALGIVLGRSRGASMFLGVSGLFCFKLIIICYAGWLTVIPTVVFLPALFAFLIALIERPSLLKSVGLALIVAACILSGHLQLLYLATLYLAALALIELWRTLRSGLWQTAAACVAYGTAAAALAAAMTAHFWLPVFADASLLSRSLGTYSFFLGSHSLSARHLLTFLHPELFGTPLAHTYPGRELWEDVAYFGIVPLTLAIYCIWTQFRTGCSQRYGSFFVYSWCSTVVLAADTPLLAALYRFLPGLNAFRLPNRLLFLTAFFGLCLAAFGFDALRKRMEAAGARRRVRNYVLVIAAAVTAAEGIYYAKRYIRTVPIQAAYPRPAFAETLNSEPSGFRAAAFFASAFNYGYAEQNHVELINGYNPYNYFHYARLIRLLNTGSTQVDGPTVWTDLYSLVRSDVLDILSTRFVIFSGQSPALPAHFRRHASFPDQPSFIFYGGLTKQAVHIVENRNAKPRVFWAADVICEELEEESARTAEAISFTNTTLITGQCGGQNHQSFTADGAIRIVRRSNNQLTAELERITEGFLVVSNVWHPGWSATLDGTPVPIRRTNIALMGVAVPPGRHTLMLSFAPPYWKLGVTISLLGAAGVLLIGMLALLQWTMRNLRSAEAAGCLPHTR